MEAQLTAIVHDERELLAWLAGGNLRGVDDLSCWDAQLTDAAAEALARAPDGDELEAVDLSWNHIGAAGAHALASRLGGLRRLRLYHNDLGESGARAVAANGARLESLNLCGNQLGDAGLAALAAGELAELPLAELPPRIPRPASCRLRSPCP